MPIGLMFFALQINIERCLAIPFDIENILVGLISLKPSYELVVSFFPLIMLSINLRIILIEIV